MLTDFSVAIRPVRKEYAFREKGYLVWCGSCIRDDDGYYYLIYARWPISRGHNGWVTSSEIAVARAISPFGPFQSMGVVMKGSGKENGWDRDVTHNPSIKRFSGRYYLYYTGNYGNGEFWNHRNHQRVGVMIANHPMGPWQRFDHPLIDAEEGSFDALVTSNPTVTLGGDGRYHMIYKAVGPGKDPVKGKLVCGAAISDDPAGPFVKHKEPILVNPQNDWSVEDPYIWYMEGRYYLIVTDAQGYFTHREKSSKALFISEDAVTWHPSETPFAYGHTWPLEGGGEWAFGRLERPQLLFDGNKIIALYCAATDEQDKECQDSFNLAIPMEYTPDV